MHNLRKFQKGLEREKEISHSIHHQNNALLISALTLRDFCGGQVDLAVLDKAKNCIKLYEIKHEDSYGLSRNQYTRLKRSADWLARIFDYKICFEVLS